MPPKAKRKSQGEKPQAPVDEKAFQVDISTSDPRTIVVMLDSPELFVICKACEALVKHLETSEKCVMEVVELGGIPRLLHLIASSERPARCHAIVCLTTMASHVAVRRLLYKTDCIPALLQLLKLDEDLIVQERASYILTLLADNYSFKVTLGKHNAHRPLLSLIQSPDPDVQRNCITILNLLMENFLLRPALLEDNGLPLIMGLLDSEYAIIQKQALLTLRSCMHHAPSREATVSGEGLSRLVTFLGEKACADLHVLTVEVLSLCLAEASSTTALQGSNCLEKLLVNITESSDPIMKKNATRTLASAALDDLSRKILHEHQAEKTFIRLLSTEDGGVAEAACAVLSNMASLKSSQQFIGIEGGVAGLIKYLGAEEGAVRVAAIHCLACLLNESPANCKIVGENDGSESLVFLLSDTEAACCQFAAECVVSMSCEEIMREELISCGAVTGLVAALKFEDSAVQAIAAQAVGMLACDQSARQQVCSNAGLEPLIKLLQSPSEKVLKNAIWAIQVCAQSPQAAEEIGRLGGIGLVETIGASDHMHCGTLAQSTVQSLLNANLPAKYWMTGALDMTDSIVNTEFYDAGPAQSSQPFVSLSELISQPPVRNQPIITVNLLTKPLPKLNGHDDSLVQGTAPTPGVGPADETPSTINSRSKSKQQQATSKSKRGKADRGDNESRLSEESHLASEDSKPTLIGLLELDQGLWDHIEKVQTTIKPLLSVREQMKELAKYVASCLGGKVEKSGPFCFELPVGRIQSENLSRLVPLGKLQQGTFQHRALLFKVLCDNLGVPCSLVRGSYTRHWNEVSIKDNSPSSYKQFVVDLMFQPGSLFPVDSPQATRYQHI